MAVKQRNYETLYLVRPDVGNDELSSLQEKIVNSIISNQGEIQKNEKWSERQLAYPINKYKNGYYYILTYKALPKVVSDIEKLLTLNRTDVLRFMTVLNEGTDQNPEETTPVSSENTESTGGEI
jgi:small subunit ribosomal protein S6